MDGYLIITRADTKRSLQQQRQRWLERTASGLPLTIYLDISNKSTDEAVDAILASINHYHVRRVAIESLSGLAVIEDDALKIADLILEAGVRFFVTSYAVPEPNLVEINQRMLRTLESDYQAISDDDLLFLVANRHATISDVHRLLGDLEHNLLTMRDDVPPRIIAMDVRRIALLAQWIVEKPANGTSLN